ncbi:MAG: diphosphomevalonate decarboxylase [Pseudomonadales bacterium]
MATTTATAHPNIALVKYWGKADAPGNIPATPSLSITLDGFRTRTSVTPRTEAGSDHIRLNGEATKDKKIDGWLADLRSTFKIPPLNIDSDNNFPTASGLASSASGFAALICAINGACDLGLDAAAQSDWARRASASAARSVFEGFATLSGPEWQAQALAPAAHWPLRVVVAITSTATKATSSSVGMQASKASSPYFEAWTKQTPLDYGAAQNAVKSKDFMALAAVAEQSCLNMHALMLSTSPPLLYWQPATLACIQAVHELRANGVPVFFTIDAGPQLKAVCLPQAASQVEQRLSGVAGVLQTHQLGLGPGSAIAQ